MTLHNSTEYSDRFIRRMMAWCCKQLDLPVRKVYSAAFRQRRKNRFSGHAYYMRGGGRIVVSLAPDRFYPWTDDGKSQGIVGIVRTLADKLECLIDITAHELKHIDAHVVGEKTRRSGYGSSERSTEVAAQRVLTTFRENRDSLLAEWNKTPDARPRPSLQEKRAAKAVAALDRWQRKAKLAATKIRQYKRKVRYYELALAATRGGNA